MKRNIPIMRCVQEMILMRGALHVISIMILTNDGVNGLHDLGG